MDWPVGWEGGSEEALAQLTADLLAFSAIVVAVLLLFSLGLTLSQPARRRHFYCAASGREVEVEFEERGLPCLRRAVAVRACSAFDPPQSVRCQRRCLDEDVRALWQAWTPMRTGRKS